MTETGKRILEAVRQKAEALCPGSLELLGVYGSALTGDAYEKSDVDLLLVADDERGRRLTDCFILEDTGVGYDLYRTSWASLEAEADCPHAHLSKLLDAEIHYARDGQVLGRLEALREKARGILGSEARFTPAKRLLEQARGEYAEACLADGLSQARFHAGETVYLLLEALMLYHGRYFRLGTKRTFAELGALGLPFDAEDGVLRVIRAETAEEIRSALGGLFLAARNHMAFPEKRAVPSRENLSGTYEEMVSNWRNKMWEAAERGDLFSSFMNLGSLQAMLRDISEEVSIGETDTLASFDGKNLAGNAAAFDAALARFAGEYAKIGLPIRRFADLDAFLGEYLSP